MDEWIKVLENQILFIKGDYPLYLEDCWLYIQSIKNAAAEMEKIVDEQYPEWEKNRGDAKPKEVVYGR